MPTSTMTCKSFFNYIINNYPDQNPNNYCAITSTGQTIGSICCQECKKYAGIRCFNMYAYVSYCNVNNLSYCNKSFYLLYLVFNIKFFVTINIKGKNGVFSDGTKFSVACAKLCGTCTGKTIYLFHLNMV